MQRNVFGFMAIAVVGGVLFISGPSQAGDASKDSVANPVGPSVPVGQQDLGQVFTDCFSKGTIATAGKKFTFKAVKVAGTATDGAHCTSDDYICISDTITKVTTQHCSVTTSQVCGPSLPACPGVETCSPQQVTDLPTVVVLHAEITANPAGVKTLSTKHDLCKDGEPFPTPTDKPLACGGTPPIVATNSTWVCYAPDTAWSAQTIHQPAFPFQINGHTCEGFILNASTTDAHCTTNVDVQNLTGTTCLSVPANGIVLRTGSSICK